MIIDKHFLTRSKCTSYSPHSSSCTDPKYIRFTINICIHTASFRAIILKIIWGQNRKEKEILWFNGVCFILFPPSTFFDNVTKKAQFIQTRRWRSTCRRNHRNPQQRTGKIIIENRYFITIFAILPSSCYIFINQIDNAHSQPSCPRFFPLSHLRASLHLYFICHRW